MTKYSDKIPEDDVQAVENNESTVEMVAEKNQVPKSAVSNKVNRKRSKLSVGFQGADADTNLPNQSKISNDESKDGDVKSTPIDATEALKGFWGLIDGVLQMTSFLSKKQIEYEKLTPKDIDDLAGVSNSNETMRKIASFDGASLLIVLGYAGTKFMPRIKINVGKHNEELALEDKCNCKECKNKRIKDKTLQVVSSKTIVEEIKESEIKNDKTKADELKEFITRNSDPKDLAQADKHIEDMKNITGKPRIAP